MLTWNVPSLEIRQPCGTEQESEAGNVSGPALPGKTGTGKFSLASMRSIPASIFLGSSLPDSHLSWKQSPHCNIRRKCRSTSPWLGLAKDVRKELGSKGRENAAVGGPKDHSLCPVNAIYYVGASHSRKCWLLSCPTVCNPMDCRPSGSSVCGILQARILAWIAIPFSRGCSRPRDWTHVSCTVGRFFTVWASHLGWMVPGPLMSPWSLSEVCSWITYVHELK